MLTLQDIKSKKKIAKVKGELPYNFPPEVIDGNEEHNYVEVVSTDYGYDIVRRCSWMRDQKTRKLHIFNMRVHQKYGVFPQGTNVCIDGWYEDEESCAKSIRTQRDHDHAVGLLKKATDAFQKGFLDVAKSIVTAALTKEKGNNELLALKDILIGEIELAKADKMLAESELAEAPAVQEALKKELDENPQGNSGDN